LGRGLSPFRNPLFVDRLHRASPWPRKNELGSVVRDLKARHLTDTITHRHENHRFPDHAAMSVPRGLRESTSGFRT
jgi:hypothetical protein